MFDQFASVRSFVHTRTQRVLMVYSTRKMLKGCLMACALLLGAWLFINPNPFGNQPAVITDETYFLTTAMKALQTHTIPGWLTGSGEAYYGGVLTYGLFFVLAGVGAVGVLMGISLHNLAVLFAYHWGDLVHIGRVLNGGAIYGVIILIGYQAWSLARRVQDASIKWFALILVAGICGSSVFSALAHTSKIWPLWAVFELWALWTVCTQEWRRERVQPMLPVDRYLTRLLILALLSLSQVPVGSLTILWIGHAWALGHLSSADIMAYIKRPLPWILIVLTGIFHISFIKSLIHVTQDLSLVGSLTINTTSAVNPWLERLWWPWKSLWATQPLVALVFVLVVLLGLLGKMRFTHQEKITLIHLGVVYALFYVVLGFSLHNRYILPLTVMVTLTVALVFTRLLKARNLVAALTTLLATAVLLKTAWLFWHPASIKLTEAMLHSHALGQEDVLILKTGYFQVPVLNRSSIEDNEMRGNTVFRRLVLLEQDEVFRKKAPPYKVLLGVPKEGMGFSASGTVWMIHDVHYDCPALKSTCWHVDTNTDPRNIGGVAEGMDMMTLFRTSLIGRSYTLERRWPTIEAGGQK